MYNHCPISVDRADRARLAANIAITYCLRGAGAVYDAVAQEQGATRITWDQERLTRGVAVVSILTPSDWLAANPVEAQV